MGREFLVWWCTSFRIDLMGRRGVYLFIPSRDISNGMDESVMVN